MSNNWPKKVGDPFFQRAMAACLTALQVQGQGDKAWRAFVDAARKAGITVLPKDAARH